ncbi:fimbria/pilus outer membrane usher protein, partial [Salmonella enterica]|uniref:fimbria/pilus outer membrane usher protein n=1 Tax=Salmonella enterica TaxID=28901 RepID=UPI00398C3FEC
MRSEGDRYFGQYHKRSQIHGNRPQNLGGCGSVDFNVTQQGYWNDEGKQRSLNAGYHGRIGRVNYSVSYPRTRSPDWDASCRVLHSPLSRPLVRVLSNFHLQTDRPSHTTQRCCTR